MSYLSRLLDEARSPECVTTSTTSTTTPAPTTTTTPPHPTSSVQIITMNSYESEMTNDVAAGDTKNVNENSVSMELLIGKNVNLSYLDN